MTLSFNLFEDEVVHVRPLGIGGRRLERLFVLYRYSFILFNYHGSVFMMLMEIYLLGGIVLD